MAEEESDFPRAGKVLRDDYKRAPRATDAADTDCNLSPAQLKFLRGINYDSGVSKDNGARVSGGSDTSRDTGRKEATSPNSNNQDSPRLVKKKILSDAEIYLLVQAGVKLKNTSIIAQLKIKYGDSIRITGVRRV